MKFNKNDSVMYVTDTGYYLPGVVHEVYADSQEYGLAVGSVLLHILSESRVLPYDETLACTFRPLLALVKGDNK